MAEPKKQQQQKTGRTGSRHVTEAIDTTTERTKSREKYKSDVPLQLNQAPLKAPRPRPSPKADGDWAEAVLKSTKTLAREIAPSESQMEPEELCSPDPDPEDMLFKYNMLSQDQ